MVGAHAGLLLLDRLPLGTGVRGAEKDHGDSLRVAQGWCVCRCMRAMGAFCGCGILEEYGSVVCFCGWGVRVVVEQCVCVCVCVCVWYGCLAVCCFVEGGLWLFTCFLNV